MSRVTSDTISTRSDLGKHFVSAPRRSRHKAGGSRVLRPFPVTRQAESGSQVHHPEAPGGDTPQILLVRQHW